MATQYKKIQNKLRPKEDPAVSSNKDKLKPKASRDALLLVLIGITLVILAIAWGTMDNISRGMYATLSIGMIVVYINRRMEFSDNIRQMLIGVSSFFLVAAIILMGLGMYNQFFG